MGGGLHLPKGRCNEGLLTSLYGNNNQLLSYLACAGGNAARIGLVWNWFSFEAKRACGGCCMPPYLPPLCAALNRAWGNQLLLSFLGHGKFDWQPMWCVGMGRARVR